MEHWMKEALKEARKAYDKKEVPVGAVIIKDNKIVARAHNVREAKQNAISHAEILCIQKACKKINSWRLDGAIMYVTLEPCAMCAGALTQSRISKVYFGAKDYKNGCVGSICNLLEKPTTWKVDYEYLPEEECSQILTEFFQQLRKEKQEKKK